MIDFPDHFPAFIPLTSELIACNARFLPLDFIGSYVDEPLMMKAGGQNYYYATNRLYSVAAISDQTGAVVERYKYDAYGKQGILAPNGVVAYKPSDYGSFHGFTGRYHDWETGLVYFRGRNLSTDIGIFISRNLYGRLLEPGFEGKFLNAGVDYVDGYSLYFAGVCAEIGLDPTGFPTWTVDGDNWQTPIEGDLDHPHSMGTQVPAVDDKGRPKIDSTGSTVMTTDHGPHMTDQNGNKYFPQTGYVYNPVNKSWSKMNKKTHADLRGRLKEWAKKLASKCELGSLIKKLTALSLLLALANGGADAHESIDRLRSDLNSLNSALQAGNYEWAQENAVNIGLQLQEMTPFSPEAGSVGASELLQEIFDYKPSEK